MRTASRMRVTPEAGHLAGEDRLRPRRLDKALRRKVIDFAGPVLAQNADQRHLVHQIAGDQREVILNMLNTLKIDGRGAPDHTNDLVALLEQKFCQITSVLTGYPGNKCLFLHVLLVLWGITDHPCLVTGRSILSVQALVC